MMSLELVFGFSSSLFFDEQYTGGIVTALRNLLPDTLLFSGVALA